MKILRIAPIFLALTLFLIFTPACTKAETEAGEVVEEQEEKPEEEPPSENVEEAEEESLVVETPEEEKEKEFSPTIVSTLTVSGVAANVYVEGDYAYFAGNTYHIIDIANKENPIEAGRLPGISWWRSGFYIEENFAYFPDDVADERGFFLEGDLQIIDISNKDIPTVIGTAESMGRIKDVWVTENYAYATYEISKTKESGIQIIDISDKKKPLTVGVYEANDFPISSIRIEGEYLYVLIGDSLSIINITDRENLVYKGSYSISGTLDFYVKGDYLYLPFENSLQIIDTSDKENPAIVGEITASGGVTDVFADGSFAYLAYVTRNSENQVERSGMQIIDVRDKSNPTLVTELEISGDVMGIFVQGDYAYVGDWSGRCLHIVKLFDE